MLVEAAACGCRIVSTELPGVVEQIAPFLGETLDLVPLPRLKGIDTPVDEDLPRFTKNLTAALGQALRDERKFACPDLGPFTWNAVFGRIEKIWREVIV